MNLSVDMRHVEEYLRAYNYISVEDWAVDAGYWYDDDLDIWRDEEGHGVDIEYKLCAMLSRALR